MTTPQFDDFWQVAELQPYNFREFVQRGEAFDSEHKQLRLDYPASPQPLPQLRKNTLEKIASRRRSQREFSAQGLTLAQVARLLASVRAWGGPEHRSYPSAGASYPVEVFLVGWRVEEYAGRMAYYDPIDHGMVILPDAAPSWKDCLPQINVRVIGEPACMIVVVFFPERTSAKYGERGGCFALLEAGAVMQQLSLTAADLGLAGVVAGGLIDHYWLDQLGISSCGGRLAFGFLVGQPEQRRAKRF